MQRSLLVALLLILSFAIAEFLVGRASHSLVLVADAGHMASDGLALVLALVAIWLAQRSSLVSAKRTRWEMGAALVNGMVLSAIALWIGAEALPRLFAPSTEIASLPMLITAAVGAGVNGVNVALLHQGSHHNLNVRAAFLHVLADALSCIGVIVAAIAVAVFQWFWADAAISLFIAGLILSSTVPLLWQTLQQLKDSGIKESQTELEVNA